MRHSHLKPCRTHRSGRLMEPPPGSESPRLQGQLRSIPGAPPYRGSVLDSLIARKPRRRRLEILYEEDAEGLS